MAIEDLDKEYFFHPFTNLRSHEKSGPLTMVTGRGSTLVDTLGREYLDAMAGLWCVNVGYGNQEIAETLRAQAEKLSYYHTFASMGNEPVAELAQRLVTMAPGRMSKVFFGNSGSDANDTQVKLVWYYNNVLGRPEKKKIISRWRGYHGSGIMTGSLTGLELFHKAFDLPRAPILHTEAPYFYRRPDRSMDEQQFSTWCAEQLEAMILAEGPDTVAAFIGEPVLGTGGVVPPPAGYWPKIQAVLKKYDILLVADEVVTAFGRLGTRFGSDAYGISPDLITVAKGMTSAYAPLSGVIVGERVWRVLEQGGDAMGVLGHGWTYSAHPICVAAGVANLKLIDQLNLVDNARDVGSYLRAALSDALAAHRHVGEVRGAGLLAAVEFVKDRDDRAFFDPANKIGPQLAAALLEEGVIARAMPQGDILGYAPPLCISRAEADVVVQATVKAVEQVLGHG
jgi:L-2,4-diaminobutyrate transaminase